jgi:hypothetical protein
VDFLCGCADILWVLLALFALPEVRLELGDYNGDVYTVYGYMFARARSLACMKGIPQRGVGVFFCHGEIGLNSSPVHPL